MGKHLSRREFLKLSRFALPLTLPPILQRESFTRQSDEGQNSQMVQPPNILIVVFDSLSALNMSLYGYPRGTTPNIDQFANRSTVYHAHYAAANFTSPGTASILIGTYPWLHRAFNLSSVPLAEYRDKNLFAEFARLGYHRMAYTHNRLANFLLDTFRPHIDQHILRRAFLLNDRQFLARVFTADKRVASMGEELAFVRETQGSIFLSLLDDVFDPGEAEVYRQADFPRGLPEAFRSAYVLETAVNGIHSAVSEAPQPFLGYFHLLPPHEPYRTRKEFKDQFESSEDFDSKPEHFFTQGQNDQALNRLRRAYDEFLAYADAEFGRLLSKLEQSGLLNNTVIVFTADHGQLFERGIHGHITPVLYEPVIRVPLLIYDPNQPDRQDIYTPSSAVDLLPTLLKIAGRETPDWCEGVVLPPYLSGTTDPMRSIYAVEAKENARSQPLSKASVAVIQGSTKLVSYFGYPGYEEMYELYDLEHDQEERLNLVSTRKTTAGEMRADLKEKLRGLNRQYIEHL